MSNVFRREPSGRLTASSLIQTVIGGNSDTIANEFFNSTSFYWTPPSVVLNTPTDTSTVGGTTPTLNFTGTTSDSLEVEYKLQVDTVNTFDSTSNGSIDVSAATYDSKSYSESQDPNPFGLTFNSDGTKVYVTTDGGFYQYGLSTAWDISTASYLSTYGPTNDSYPRGIAFKADGTKMYAMDFLNNWISQYSLSTAWDITSATYDSKSYTETQDAASPRAIFFKPDGTKLYMLGNTALSVYQYSLSVAWDISTVTYDTKSFAETHGTDLYGLAFNTIGTKLIISCANNQTAYQYSLSTAWDVSTATYDSKSLVETHSAAVRGIFLKPDNTKLYTISTNVGDIIYQYSLPSAGGAPLIEKVSTTDIGFSGTPDNTHPFDSGQAVDYTVQSDMAPGTYYWRGAAKDPLGTNNYGEWSPTWSFTVPEPPFVVSGTSNQTSGTVKVAINSTPDNTNTGTIAGDGSWSVSGVTKPTAGDAITAFISDATTANISTAVTIYNGSGVVGGMVLDKHVLSIGSDQNCSLTVTDLGKYGYSNDSHVMHGVSGSTLTVDAGSAFSDEKINILTDNILTIGATETLTTYDLAIATTGTLIGSGATTINVAHDWANSGTFTAGSSTVTLNGTATQALSGTLNSTSAFYNLTITNNSGASASDNERTGFTPSVDFNAAAKVTNNYTITTANVRVEYQTAATYEFNNINWNGQATGTKIYFRNSDATTTWLLKVTGTQTAVSYVNVSRSDASVSGGTTISAFDGTNFNAGNDTNWIFVNTRIRQEINLYAGSFSSVNTAPVKTFIPASSLNPAYSGTLTSYFEIVATNTDSSSKTVELRTWGDTLITSVSIPNGTSAPTRFRSNSFTFPGSLTNVYTYIPQTTSAAQVVVSASRVIVTQDVGSNPITSTETQIEIGNYETPAKVNTGALALNYPKYWLYTGNNWNGTKTFYAEATFSTALTNRYATITLQKDLSGDMATWSDVVIIVNAQASTVVNTAVVSARVAFTPVDGCNYRITSFCSAASASYYIYNTKIIVSQTGTITKFEPQYLIQNTYKNATGLQNFDTSWNTGEWGGVRNTYYHEINSSSDTADSAKLQSDPNGTPADVTGSTATGTAYRARSSALTMPATTTLDTYISNVPIYASRIIVAVDLAPDVVLNTPSEAGAVSSTPTLNFTGTDPSGDDIEYNVQIDTANTFDSGAALGFNLKYIGVALGYLGNPTDNVFIDVRSTSISGSTLGTSNAVAASSIRAQAYYQFTFGTAITLVANTKYYLVLRRSAAYDGSNYIAALYGTTSAYSGGGLYVNNSGTWTGESGTNDAGFVLYNESAVAIITQTGTLSATTGIGGATGIQQEAGQSFTTSASYPPLLSKFSNVDIGDFTGSPDNTHPFASGQAVDYTVQSALDPDTYYWRVAAIDPSGNNIYGSWSATRSFIITPPSVVLNTPTDAQNVADFTPTLDFTGTDPTSGDLEYDVQIDTVNTFDSIVADNVVIDSYDIVNATSLLPMYSGSNIRIGQSFTAEAGVLSKATFYIGKGGSPTGTIVAYLFAHTGAYGGVSGGTGSALATSSTVNISTITGNGLIDFDFSASPYTLVNGTYYVIVAEFTGGSVTNYIGVGADGTSPTHSGVTIAYQVSGGWGYNSATDTIFYIYVKGIDRPIVDRTSGLVIADKYDQTNSSSSASMYGASTTSIGQSFTAKAGLLYSSKFALFKTGSPTGNLIAKLYTHTGTYGGGGLPYYNLATSGTFNVSTLTGTNIAAAQFIELTFIGKQRFYLTNGRNYYIALEYSGGDASNYINVCQDNTSPTHAGQSASYVSSWSAASGVDNAFAVYIGNDDTGFDDPDTSDTHPFYSGSNIQYTVDGMVSSYYFDASDAAASDPNSNWTDDSNAFDGNTATYAKGGISTTTTGYLMGEGTNAPSWGGTIGQVRARIYGKASSNDIEATIYTSGLAESLGTAITSNADGWGDYTTLSTPSGGWTWAKVQALETKIWVNVAGTEQMSKVGLEVTSELTPGTYYWRARAIAPSSGNVYGNWSSTWSFTITTGVTGIKVWNGTDWVYKPVKVYNGSTWVAKPVKVYDGADWVVKG